MKSFWRKLVAWELATLMSNQGIAHFIGYDVLTLIVAMLWGVLLLYLLFWDELVHNKYEVAKV